jgi:hypothetical protein
VAIIFVEPEQALAGLRRLSEEGLEGLDLYSPYHLREVETILPTKPHRVSLGVFAGGSVGALSAYLLQYVTAVELYPFQVGGTPLHSWPAFLPFTFEAGVLLASFAAFFSVFFWSGLPRFHHPVFQIPDFDRVSRDRFVVVIPDQSLASIPELEGGEIVEF